MGRVCRVVLPVHRGGGSGPHPGQDGHQPPSEILLPWPGLLRDGLLPGLGWVVQRQVLHLESDASHSSLSLFGTFSWDHFLGWVRHWGSEEASEARQHTAPGHQGGAAVLPVRGARGQNSGDWRHSWPHIGTPVADPAQPAPHAVGVSAPLSVGYKLNRKEGCGHKAADRWGRTRGGGDQFNDNY